MLGSAFNPPHLGHVVLAQEAHARLGLAEVVLVPTGRAPHKEIEDDPGAGVRLEMTRLAVGDDERFAVSELETSRDEPSFTYRTLETAAGGASGRRAGVRDRLRRGRRARAVAQPRADPRARVAGGGGAARVEHSEVEAVVERLGGRAEFVDMPHIEVSSTMVRERVGEGRPVRYLVPDAVAELIYERGMYATAGAGEPRARWLRQA